MADPNSPTSKSPSIDASLHLNVPSSSTTAFASPSQARVLQLHLDLHNVSKGADSMANYLQKVKSISDALALASTPVSDEDLIIYILCGLGDEYRAFVTSISTRGTSITLADLHGLLLTEEIRAQSALMHLSNASTHTATKPNQPDPNSRPIPQQTPITFSNQTTSTLRPIIP
ncbi:UBN2 domain-containing protein [Cephalotus follicularis]|uniref:UBN2 domain-containing protein n=1 Tax=Cephalotus follicularis TaxID=3775 RepID=A0A1Q3C402_CEPFO|nr:UBN2 domain-containing protein [Cephalotus follicularis]